MTGELEIKNGEYRITSTSDPETGTKITISYDRLAGGRTMTLTAPVQNFQIKAIFDWARDKLFGEQAEDWPVDDVGFLTDLATIGGLSKATGDRLNAIASMLMEPKKEPETFGAHPMSITEHKGMRDANAAKWTPRDALISLLRDIDNGELPGLEVLVISHSRFIGDPKDGVTRTGWSAASPNALWMLGTLEYAKQRILNAGME
jgi:hypothetical protein